MCANCARKNGTVHDLTHMLGTRPLKAFQLIHEWKRAPKSIPLALPPHQVTGRGQLNAFMLFINKNEPNAKCPVELMNELGQTHSDSAKFMNLMCCNVRRGVNNSISVAVWRGTACKRFPRCSCYAIMSAHTVRNEWSSRPENRVLFVVIANSQTMTATSIFSMVFTFSIVIRWQCVAINELNGWWRAMRSFKEKHVFHSYIPDIDFG